jgi:Mn2+/Fe2+ NRAMP family transporter
MTKRPHVRLRNPLLILSLLGPGLITASAGNDAPGIATYSMAGSRYGYAFLWIVLWIAIGSVAVQEMAARMGAVTGKGFSDLVRERFGLRMTFLIMLALVAANLGTTAAEFAGVGSSAELFGISRYVAVPSAGIFVWLLVTRGTYRRVERVLLALSLYSIAYLASAVMAHPPMNEVLRHTLIPTIRFDQGYVLAILATIGTTITPWAVVYMQASIADRGTTMSDFGQARLDVIVGTLVGNTVSACIIIAAAATLFTRGIVVNGAAEAAMALAPLAGKWAEVLFGAGLLGASLLAASVLPLATTYAVCESFGWERGLDRRANEAPIFYGLYTSLIVLSVLVVLIPGLPLFALMWMSQVANAVLLPIILLLMLVLVNDIRIMKTHRNRRITNVVVAALGLLISLATVALFFGGGGGT